MSNVNKNVVEINKSIIQSLIPYAHHDRLNYLVNKLVPGLTGDNRILLIAEIRTQATDCLRVLDFRPMFDDCNLVEHKTINHYLDPESEILFSEKVKENHGVLNTEIYNNISSFANQKYIDETKAKESTKARTEISSTVNKISLVNQNIYREEQSTLNSKARIFPYPTLGMSKAGREANGIEIKVNHMSRKSIIIETKQPIKDVENKFLYLWLYDHNNDVDFKDDIEINCEIVTEQEKNGAVVYQLRIASGNDIKMLGLIKEFFNKRDESIREEYQKLIMPLSDSVRSKSYEQFLIPMVQDIPIICMDGDNDHLPTSVLETKNNKEFINYFIDENKQYRFSRIFNHPDIKKEISENGVYSGHIYILRTELNNIIHYHYVLSSEYDEIGDSKVFVDKHVITGDYRYVRLTMHGINSAVDGFVPASVPGYVSPEIAFQNRPVGTKPAEILAKSPYFALISDATEMHKSFPRRLRSQPKPGKLVLLTYPMRHALPAFTDAPDVNLVIAQDNDIRTEDRFDIMMDVVVTKIGTLPCRIRGKTRNVSTKGLLLSLITDHNFKNGMDIKLTLKFPDYFNGGTVIEEQSYQVLGGDCSNLRLTINDPGRRHLARQTIRKFIYKNMDKLKPSGQVNKNEIYGLQRCMRNIYANNHQSIPFFIQQDFLQWHISEACLSDKNALRTLCTDYPTTANIDATMQLFTQNKFRDVCLTAINKIDKKDPSLSFYIFVLPRGDNKIETFWIKNIKDLNGSSILKNALLTLKKMGKPTVLKIQISKTSRVLDKYYIDELNILKKLSEAESDMIKRDIEETVGIGEITDYSDQYLALANNWLEEQKPRTSPLKNKLKNINKAA